MRKQAIACVITAVLAMAAGCAHGAGKTPVVQPYEVAVAVATPTPTPVAEKMPTPVPTPTPTPTPVPTADPFTGLTRVSNPDDARFFYVPLNDTLKTRIIGSTYPEKASNAPVPIDDLRYVHIQYFDFEGTEHEGELIVHRLVADDVMTAFFALYKEAYPLASVRLLDDFGEPFNDNVSMSANNSSAYCCRRVTGSRAFSLHAYGFAIDINPVQNPYVNGKKVSPPEGEPFVDRTKAERGMIDHDDLCYQVFTALGWKWGGDFKGDPDYQHFSKDLRDDL